MSFRTFRYFIERSHEALCSDSWRRYQKLGSTSGLGGEPSQRAIDSITKTLKGASSELENFVLLDQNFFLKRNLLLKVDSMSMAHSVEARCPFLDYDLVSYAQTIPLRTRASMFACNKKLLRRVMSYKAPGARLPEKRV